jgi:hypothetical protein
MRKILISSIAMAIVLGGCTKESSGPKTVADFLHDIDTAKVMVKEISNDPSKKSDERYRNASRAYMLSLNFQCWESPRSTATTNHDCLDAKGYKR